MHHIFFALYGEDISVIGNDRDELWRWTALFVYTNSHRTSLSQAAILQYTLSIFNSLILFYVVVCVGDIDKGRRCSEIKARVLQTLVPPFLPYHICRSNLNTGINWSTSTRLGIWTSLDAVPVKVSKQHSNFSTGVAASCPKTS